MINRQVLLADKVYVELVRSLFVNVTPSAIMAVAFTLSVALIVNETRDRLTLTLGVAGVLAMGVRIIVTLRLRGQALASDLHPVRARQLELMFLIPQLSFALALGLFSGLVILQKSDGQPLMVCLVVGFCAGLAAGSGLRPPVAVPGMLAASLPTALAAFIRADAMSIATGASILAFLYAGAQSLATRHESAVTGISKRLTSGSLARRDPLTNLANRLALRERFDEAVVLKRGKGIVAVHYLDLDGFKPVNDTHGHAAGDTLLQMVAKRLSSAIRSEDIVARLGGDEFVIVQFGLDKPEDATLLSDRVVRAIAQPFVIEGNRIRISTCIGTATARAEESHMEVLMREADEALYAAKRRRAQAQAAQA
ncbi:diguanylate cyclase (GGDEF)-like protein [Sphingobium sp. B1D7B]|uniref:GGDEF domain-containing protein n=1 Tax=Sphingobium sp. B1D7B TaxID=2940578 RepID=UPI0029CAC5AC|nr:GGDEF domain-containing protein [Sphingobium sp. B1D7B]MCW2403543.1 diguanylate cyclase (GGDEF)-like protein [Sphingobium sp. B1D7B]